MEDFANLNISGLPPRDIEFGHKLIPYFQMEKNYLNLNFGSFGSAPHYVVRARENYTSEMEFNPDKWVKMELQKRLSECKQTLAKYINVPDKDDLVLVENASEATNAIFKSLKLTEDDVIFYFDISYGMVEKVTEYALDTSKVKSIKFNLTEDIIQSHEKIVDALKKFLDNYKGKITIAIIDHISSVPSFIWPLKELISLFRQKGSLVFIDGAHAIGQVDIDISAIDPDFYLSNCHKWALSCKGSAFLYTKKEHQKLLHPVSISMHYNENYSKEFSYRGGWDYANFLSIQDALNFRQHIGDDRIKEYNHNLAVEAGKLVAKLWNTEMLISDETMIGSIVNVRVPIEGDENYKDLTSNIFKKFNTFIIMSKFSNCKWYARFSCQIFNKLEDYEKGAKFILDYFEFCDVKN